VTGDPYERVDADRVRGADQLSHIAEIKRAVLGVDPGEVVAGVADSFDDLGAGQLNGDPIGLVSALELAADPPWCDSHGFLSCV